MVDIKIDGDVAREIVQKAIFESLDQSSRELLVADAINKLTLRPPKEPYAYGRAAVEPRSPLEEAFDRNIHQVSNQVVREYLEDDKVKEAIRTQIFAALDQIVSREGDWLYEQIGIAVGNKIAEVLAGKRD